MTTHVHPDHFKLIVSEIDNNQADNTALYVGVSVCLVLLLLFLTCLGVFTYHYKKKTRHYVNFVNWYYKPIKKAYKKKVSYNSHDSN